MVSFRHCKCVDHTGTLLWLLLGFWFQVCKIHRPHPLILVSGPLVRYLASSTHQSFQVCINKSRNVLFSRLSQLKTPLAPEGSTAECSLYLIPA